MPDMTEIYAALRNADAAGDTAAAQKLAAYIQSHPTAAQPAQPSSFMDEVKGGIASGPINAYLGVKQLISGGLTDEEKSVLQQNAEAAKKAPVSSILGNAAMFAPTAFIPGANTVTGAGLIGAAGNALTTPGTLLERFKAATLGGVGGMAGAGIAKFAASKTPVQIDPNVQRLVNEGISLTPGQNAGGLLKSMEDKSTSIPFLGNVINSARNRGIEDFNKAAISRATLPGMDVQGVGNTALQELRSGLGNAYDDILAKSSANALEPQYSANMNSLRNLVSALPEREQKAFDAIIQREIAGRAAPSGMINAENLQGVKSGIGEQISNFSSSNDAYQRQLGQALKQADAEFRDLVSRANPQNADDLKAIDMAYANFKRLQRAASSVGAEQGVFTPAQLLHAVKAADKSKDKRAFSEGTALLQDLASAGKAVMPSKIPDSGTAGRLMNNLFSLEGLMSTAGGAAAAIPAYAAYSRPGTSLINATVNSSVPVRNELMRLLAQPTTATIGMTLPKLVGY